MKDKPNATWEGNLRHY